MKLLSKISILATLLACAAPMNMNAMEEHQIASLNIDSPYLRTKIAQHYSPHGLGVLSVGAITPETSLLCSAIIKVSLASNGGLADKVAGKDLLQQEILPISDHLLCEDFFQPAKEELQSQECTIKAIKNILLANSKLCAKNIAPLALDYLKKTLPNIVKLNFAKTGHNTKEFLHSSQLKAITTNTAITTGQELSLCLLKAAIEKTAPKEIQPFLIELSSQIVSFMPQVITREPRN